ncbi:MAG: hypothetical protein KC419_08785, partial [Anaerolineales bacterium]|nr:hypothetical protein [Anaerolineales bacterium]
MPEPVTISVGFVTSLLSAVAEAAYTVQEFQELLFAQMPPEHRTNAFSLQQSWQQLAEGQYTVSHLDTTTNRSTAASDSTTDDIEPAEQTSTQPKTGS